MIVCVACRIAMRCDKNGVGAHFGGKGHVYPADRFKCPDCGVMILNTNAKPIYDPELQTQEEYLDCEG